MLKLYAHPASPYSMRVQVFLEEIAEPYRYERIELEKGENTRRPYKDLNPYKRVPAIELGGFVLAESNAILRYLAQRFGRYDWYPQGLEERAIVDQWMDFAGFHAGTPLSNLAWERFWLPRFNQESNVKEAAKIIKKLEREMPIINQHLEKHSYLAAPHLTLADLTFLPMVFYGELAEYPITSYPAIARWYGELTGREAWQKVVQSSGVW